MLLPPDLLVGLLHFRLHQLLLVLYLQPLLRQYLHLLLFKILQLLPYVRIHIVRNVPPIVYLWDCVVFPLLSDDVVLLEGDVEYPRAAVLLLELLDVGAAGFLGKVHLHRRALEVVPGLGLGHVHPGQVPLLRLFLVLLRDTLLDAQHRLTGLLLDLLNPHPLNRTHLQRLQPILLHPPRNLLPLRLLHLPHPLQVRLTKHHQDRLVLEQRFDCVVEMDLLEDRVTALFGWVDEVKHAGF